MRSSKGRGYLQILSFIGDVITCGEHPHECLHQLRWARALPDIGRGAQSDVDAPEPAMYMKLPVVCVCLRAPGGDKERVEWGV